MLELGRTSRAENFWTLNDAFQGVQVFGATGSGKSSGSGKAIARAFLESNMGGLVLTAKVDERANWEEYCADTGRSEDLVIFGEGETNRFNLLLYEQARQGKGAGNIENLVNLCCAVMEAADRKSGGGMDSYWNRALKQLLRNAIDLLVIATNELDLAYLYRLVTSAPTSIAEAADQKWRQESDCYTLLEAAKITAVEKNRLADFKITQPY